MSTTEIHAEKETLSVEVNIPGHEERTTTSLFTRSKKALLARDGARCYICNRTAEQSGHPLESHHHPIERSMANMIDWDRFAVDAKAGVYGPHAQAFDWDSFFDGATVVKVKASKSNDGTITPARSYRQPVDVMLFVDDQTVNGVLLCKAHHTGKDEGIHTMPFPLWIAQKYAIEGYQFSDIEVIHYGT